MKLRETTILRCITGSVSYGLATPESDVDRLEIYATPTTAFLGLREPTDATVGKDGMGDYQKWELRKFLRLCLQGNPQALEVVFAPERCLLEESYEGRAIRAMREAFVSKRAADRYIGFATRQRRLLEEVGGASHGGGKPMLQVGETYGPKAAMHCLRLLIQGTTLLNTGTLLVDMAATEHYETLRAIRANEWGKTRVLTELDKWLEWIRAAEQENDLPSEPDESRVNDWLVSVRKVHL